MLFDDSPISSSSQDILSRAPFVSRLVSTIKAYENTKSLVIALYGEWGSGKSSVLNMLHEKLKIASVDKQDGTIIVLHFDPWFFNSAEELLDSFFKVLEDKLVSRISKRKSRRKLKSLFKKYRQKLTFSGVSFEPKISFFGGLISLGAGIKNDRRSDLSPENLRRDIETALLDTTDQVVILIDNLDRLDSRELLLTMKLVRLCSDFPRFIYVLAFDPVQVSNILVEFAKIDPQFLSKIVQVDIKLPRVDQSSIDELVKQSLQNIVHEHEIVLETDLWDRFGPTYRSAMSGKILCDLRSSKKFLNAVAFSMPLMAGEVNIADFLILETIRVFYPVIYQDLPNYKKQLTSFDSLVAGDYERKERHKVFQELLEWTKNEVESIQFPLHRSETAYISLQFLLTHLFPTLGAYISNPSNPTLIIFQYVRDEYRKGQRICVASYFDRYFRLRVPQDEIPTAVITNFISSLDNMNSDDAEALVNALLSYQIEGQLVNFLRKCQLYVNELNATGKKNFITLLSEISEVLEWRSHFGQLTDGLAVILLLLDYLLVGEDNSVAEAELNRIVENTASLAFASVLVTSTDPRRKQPKLSPEFNYEQLIDSLRTRINKQLIDARENVFITHPTSFHAILSAWRSTNLLNEPEAASDYVYEMLNITPEKIGALLAMYVMRELSTGRPHEFNYADFIELYDADKFYKLLKERDVTGAEDAFEDYGITEFLRIYLEG